MSSSDLLLLSVHSLSLFINIIQLNNIINSYYKQQIYNTVTQLLEMIITIK